MFLRYVRNAKVLKKYDMSYLPYEHEYTVIRNGNKWAFGICFSIEFNRFYIYKIILYTGSVKSCIIMLFGVPGPSIITSDSSICITYTHSGCSVQRYYNNQRLGHPRNMTISAFDSHHNLLKKLRSIEN